MICRAMCKLISGPVFGETAVPVHVLNEAECNKDCSCFSWMQLGTANKVLGQTNWRSSGKTISQTGLCALNRTMAQWS